MAPAAQRKRVESAANGDETGRSGAECRGWVLCGRRPGRDGQWGFDFCSFLSSVHEERRGSSLNVTQVVDGDASVTLTKLKVRDEGSYICTVSLGPFKAQQIVQLHLLRECSVVWNYSFELRYVRLMFPGCGCRTTPGVAVTAEAGFEGGASDAELPLL